MTGSATPPMSEPRHARRRPRPFRGLAYYTEADTDFFFGRTMEREIIGAHLRTARLTLLYAESGVGKSSLLRAGVAADLRHDADRDIEALGTPKFVPVVFIGWKDDPAAALTAEILRVAERYKRGMAKAAAPEPSRPPRDDRRPPGSGVEGGLSSVINRAADDLNATFVIILDQFEEIFGYQEHPEVMADELGRCINSRDVRAHFLIAIREDAYGKLGDLFAGRIADVYGNYLHLEYLTREEALEAIYGPVDAYNNRHRDNPVEIGDGLAETVISEVRRGHLLLGSGREEHGRGNGSGFSSSDEVEAPFLQLVMDRLWEFDVERVRDQHDYSTGKKPRLVLSRESLEEDLGGAEKIVRDHLNRALAGLSPSERETANAVFSRLVTPSGVKVAHTAADLAAMTGQSQRAIEQVLEALDDKRIVRGVNAAPGTHDERYELFHDRLARPILAWRSRRENERLASEKRAAEEEAERQRAETARARRTARIAWSLAALCAVLLVGAVALALYANNERRAAQTQATTAATLAMASNAQLDLAARPDVSLLLSLAAYRLRPHSQAANAMMASLEAFRSTGALAILHGNIDTVNRVAFSPDGETLASAGGDGTIRFWKVSTHREIAWFQSSEFDGVTGLAFSRDGAMLATAGGDDLRVRILDTRTHTQIGQLTRLDRDIPGHPAYVYDVAFSRDGRTLAIATANSGIELWDVRSHRRALSLSTCHCDTSHKRVASVAFSPDGRLLAAGGYDNVVRLWSFGRMPHLVAQLRGHRQPISCVTFSRDGHVLASTARDGSVRLWRVAGAESKSLGRPFTAGGGPVEWAVFSPNGREFASGGDDGKVLLWSIQSHRSTVEFTGHVGTVLGVAFSPDGRVLASGGVDGTIRLWPSRQPSAFGAKLLIPRGAQINSVAVSRTGNTIAVGAKDGTISLWDAQTRTKIGRPLNGRSAIVNVALSPDGRELASATNDGTIRLWNVQKGSVVARRAGHEHTLTAVAFSPNGTTLASAGYGGVRLWTDSDLSHSIGFLPTKKSTVESLAFSPDGLVLATGSDDRRLRLWGTRSHKELAILPEAKNPVVTALAFSPDGRTLAAGGSDKSILLFDVLSRHQLLRPLTGSTGQVFAVAFSPDGTTLASGNGDDTVRFWDPTTGIQLGPRLAEHDAFVESVAFLPGSKQLVSASHDSVRLWGGVFWNGLTDLERKVCALTGGGLTREEWGQYLNGVAYHESCPPNMP